MGFTNTTFASPSATDFAGMGTYNNTVTSFHGYGLFGPIVLLSIWFFIFITLSRHTDKAFLASSTVAALIAYPLWIIGWLNAEVIIIPTVLTFIGLIMLVLDR